MEIRGTRLSSVRFLSVHVLLIDPLIGMACITLTYFCGNYSVPAISNKILGKQFRFVKLYNISALRLSKLHPLPNDTAQ